MRSPSATPATPKIFGSVRLILGALSLAFLLAPASGYPRSARAYSFDDAHHWLATAEDYPRWADLIARHRAERPLMESCVQDYESCPRYLRGYHRIIRRAPDMSDRVKLRVVNRFVNRRRWVRDRDEKRQPDETWSTLNAFLRDGGDCEDFAFAKYFMLRDLGFAADELRVVISWDRKVRAYHAVVAVNMDGRALLMETDDTIRRSREHRAYRFVFAINEIGMWDHAAAAGMTLR